MEDPTQPSSASSREAALTTELASLREKTEQWKRAVKSQLEEAQQKNAALRTEVRTLQDKLHNFSSKEAELANITKELNDVRAARAADLKQSSEDVHQLQARLTAEHDARVEAEKRSRELQIAHEAEMAAERRYMELEIKKMNESAKAAAKTELPATGMNIADELVRSQLMGEITHRDEQIHTLQNLLRCLQSDLAVLQEQQDGHDAMTAALRESTEQRVLALNNEVTRQRLLFEKADAEKKELLAVHGSMEREVAQLREEAAIREKAFNDLFQEDTKSAELREAESKLRAVQSQCAEASAKITALQAELVQAAEERAALRGALDRRVKELDDREAEVGRKETKLARFEKNLHETKTEIATQAKLLEERQRALESTSSSRQGPPRVVLVDASAFRAVALSDLFRRARVAVPIIAGALFLLMLAYWWTIGAPSTGTSGASQLVLASSPSYIEMAERLAACINTTRANTAAHGLKP